MDEKKLRVYQIAMDLCKDIYGIKFPSEERFGLQSQIRRASTSIPLLIAEGCGRETSPDFKHFLVQARGSSKEVSTALDLSKNLGFLDTQTHTKLSEQARITGAMLTQLIKKVGGKQNENKAKSKTTPPQTTKPHNHL